MNKVRIAVMLLVGLMMLILSSCGSEGTGGGAGGGTTVVVSAQTQSAQPTTAFATTGAPPFTEDNLKFTITSTPYAGVTSIQPSPVQIVKQRISFIPLPDSNGAMSPPLPSFEETATGTITPGGALNLEIGIVVVGVKKYVYDNYAEQLTNSVQQYNYSVAVDFIGVEINTGTQLSCRAYANAFIFR